MAAAKRFPDRVEIAAVRAECEPLEAGESIETSRRIAGRGDGAPRHGQARLPRRRRPHRPDPGDLRCGQDRGARRPARRCGRDCREPRPGASRRAFALRRHGRGSLAQHATASRHVPRSHRRRAALPQALPRPARQRGDARRFRPPGADRHGGARLPRRGGLRRGRDAGAAAALRRCLRTAVRHAPQRARARSLSADRDRAVLEAADRRRSRARVRDRQGLSQRGCLVQAQPRVHDARVVRGLRGLPRHDGADRGAASRPSRRRCSARRQCSSAVTSSS